MADRKSSADQHAVLDRRATHAEIMVEVVQAQTDLVKAMARPHGRSPVLRMPTEIMLGDDPNSRPAAGGLARVAGYYRTNIVESYCRSVASLDRALICICAGHEKQTQLDETCWRRRPRGSAE